MFVKAPVFPFVRFPGVDTILGPEMKSTGEVMGGASSFGTAFAKAQLGAGQRLPLSGAAFISVNNDDKPNVLGIARDLAGLGFKLVATRGTAAYLRAHGLDVDVAYKINEGRPHVGDRIYNKEIALVINTPMGRESFFDDRTVRRAAMMNSVPCITTLTGGAATVSAIRALRDEGLEVRSLQEYHASVPRLTRRPRGDHPQSPRGQRPDPDLQPRPVAGRGDRERAGADLRRLRDHRRRRRLDRGHPGRHGPLRSESALWPDRAGGICRGPQPRDADGAGRVPVLARFGRPLPPAQARPAGRSSRSASRHA